MCKLYLTEQGSKMGVAEGRFQITVDDKIIKSVPYSTVESVEVYGNVQLTTQCLTKCFSKNINVNYYTTHGNYWGNFVAAKQSDVDKQRQQCLLYDNYNFRSLFTKIILEAKINNQIVLLRRYARHKKMDITKQVKEMNKMREYVNQHNLTKPEMLIGFEGYAANVYFTTIGKIINSEYKFEKRTRRPPEDPYNALIGLGYSVIHNEIYGKLVSNGINPYFGIVHKIKSKHPALVSDLIEEWRPILVDSLALAMLNGNELTQNNFTYDKNTVYVNKIGFNKFIKKLEDRLNTKQKYLHYVDYPVTFRQALDLQINQLSKALKSSNARLYWPVRVR